MSEEEAKDTQTTGEDKPDAAAAPSAAVPRKSSSAVAWLALLLVLALGGGAAWLLPQLQRAKSDLVERVESLRGDLDGRVSRLEDTSGRERADLDALESRIRSDVESSVDALEAELRERTARLSESLAAAESQLKEQRAELSRFSAADRDKWLLAEVEYLLRLANQRLVMAGDTTAARALLDSADKVLREVDDAGLHEVRGAVAADLAAVRAVPTIDVEGIYLRLAALVEQAEALVIFQMPAGEERPEPEPAADWQDRLRQGYEEALRKLSDYIVIRRRDTPMQTLMDPQWEGLVRQNLRMLLEQAQVALLSGNQVLYRESLERARHWVGQFMESDSAAAGAMSREIAQLADLRIAVDMPDLARSLRALDAAMQARTHAPADGAGD